MITTHLPLGDVRFSAEYFSTLVGEAAKNWVADTVKSLVRGEDFADKGVRVTSENGRLIIEIHIAVGYGLNIATAAQSITHRVQDEVERSTGLRVARVIVSVDDVIA